ncbi:hypothetical protein A3J15_04065 [Candidatus Roizmanbacteria bacterium RIFCSPLOWO2_02_FULL_38_10]|uniref:Membrane protein 6-pyruvoyl-tetrahydropterin synthase-related domain-containing protein n=1 Tax=Candidatus Roizmanbacteria bacterium RIFCSPLOWO2_02_FULL_38_10 TaxID=1802074 RepID=A0A1F7JP69_9BACT|nr:MAG: hypothetical protein A3J15_04065 [Candidatus Roizmanbacteria bacterium RIFCSPLOWO2_02_FULL_38_10]
MAIYNRLDLSSVAIRRLCIFGFWLFLLLSYYFVPFFLYSQYRSFSYWDPLWKFNSFGLFQILTWVLNGELFDLNRLPLMTLSVFAGFFAVFVTKNRRMRLFGLLFIFYFIFFLGRVSPFGKAIDLIPGFSEFHLHRFIVMVQFIGIFLAAFWLESGINKIWSYLKKVSLIKIEVPIREILVTVILICSIILFRYLEKPVIEYSKLNREWTAQGNILSQKDEEAYRELSEAIRRSNPGRLYAGRPGNWGRDLKVGDTAIYMALSRDGHKGIGFAPESWSPNSEFDQFFNENDINSYRLYNVTHAVYPDNLTIPKFFKLIGKFGKFYLYRIKTDGWFSAGTSSSLINSNKTHLFNIVHFWMTTDGVKNNEYPQISFGKTENNLGKNYIRMADLNRYYSGNDKTQKRLWEKNPLYDGHDSQASRLVKTGEKALISGYSATFKLTKDCSYCVAVLKQTYHPNWQIKVNEEPVKAYPVFPFYIGIPIQKAGSYKIEAVYRPNSLKIGLLIITVMVTVVYLFRKKLKIKGL